MHWKLFVTILAAAGLTACSPAAAPALNPTAQGATELAAVNGMLTQTSAAIPRRLRATPLPPPTTLPAMVFQGTELPGQSATQTPQPATLLPVTVVTPLPSPLPITGATSTALAGVAPTTECNHFVNVAAAGGQVRVATRNESKGAVIFSIGLSRPNTSGQCGYIARPPIRKSSKTVVEAPQSRPDLGDVCYWAYALINRPDSQSTITGHGFCLRPGQHWVFDITDNQISLSAH